jgi:hypothetical protein
VKAEEEMTERVQQMSFIQDLGSSSDSFEISLEEIPSNFIEEDEEESQTDAFPNQNLEIIEEKEISDEESEENVIRFPPREEIEARDDIPLDDTEAEGDEPINQEREPRLSFSAVVRLILAVQRLRKKTKTNSFVGALQPLQVALNLGYYFLVVPFKIVLDQNGKFKIHVNLWQMVCPHLLWFNCCNYYLLNIQAMSICVFLLVINRQIIKISYSMKFATLKSPDDILASTNNLFKMLMIVAYLFIIGCKRAEIKAVFDKFDLKTAASVRAYEGKKYKVV